MKYIEIDGKKYKVDPNDSTKALLGADGLPVPYVEEAPAPAPKPHDHEFKMANDPEYARIYNRNLELEEEARKKAEKDEEERRESLRKNGEFQKLAEEETAKRKAAETAKAEAESVLEKYKGTVNEIRDEMLEQIPEDKRTLIPQGSARVQIDYIRKNAKFLGVSLVNKGGDVPPNTDTPPLDEEGKLQKEYADLLKKENLTFKEKERMSELARLIKTVRSRKV
jgi:hypothetical protein